MDTKNLQAWKCLPRGDLEYVGARGCYQIFLTELRHHINKTLLAAYQDPPPDPNRSLNSSSSLNSLNSRRVEYIFSVPTTWNEDTIKYFKEEIREAGFGLCLLHSYYAGSSLTEADAAAIYTMEMERVTTSDNTERFGRHFPNGEIQAGDIIVVADLGGATTVSPLQVLHYSGLN